MKGLPAIEGWEYTGEWRHAKTGEGMIDTGGNLHVHTSPYRSVGKYPILHRKRWRAEHKKIYYNLNTCLIVDSTSEYYSDGDNLRYQVGNYFQTKEEAEQARERVIKALKGEE